jgi:hypothetical protein
VNFFGSLQDIVETNAAFEIYADCPGMKPEEVRDHTILYSTWKVMRPIS